MAIHTTHIGIIVSIYDISWLLRFMNIFLCSWELLWNCAGFWKLLKLVESVWMCFAIHANNFQVILEHCAESLKSLKMFQSFWKPMQISESFGKSWKLLGVLGSSWMSFLAAFLTSLFHDLLTFRNYFPTHSSTSFLTCLLPYLLPCLLIYFLI